jgi:hypothetical protein
VLTGELIEESSTLCRAQFPVMNYYSTNKQTKLLSIYLKHYLPRCKLTKTVILEIRVLEAGDKNKGNWTR